MLLVSTDERTEPRFQVSDGDRTAQIFGLDVEGLQPGRDAIVDAGVLGYPVQSLERPQARGLLGPGTPARLRNVQAIRRTHGQAPARPRRRPAVVECARESLQRAREDAHRPFERLAAANFIGQEDSAAPGPADTKYVKRIRIQSERLTKFWGRPMYPGALVTLPEGWDTIRTRTIRWRSTTDIFNARCQDGARRRRIPSCPRPTLPTSRSTARTATRASSARRTTTGCSRTTATSSSRDGPASTFPRVIMVTIHTQTLITTTRYAVNSENLGPYGVRDHLRADSIHRTEVSRFRAVGACRVWRLDRWVGSARRSGALSGSVQRCVGELSRSD